MMVQLSKLTNNNPLLLSDFDFYSFSSSKNWIGYFERKNQYSFKLVDEATALFNTFFKDKESNIIALTMIGCIEQTTQERDIMLKYKDIYSKFKKMGIIRVVSDKTANLDYFAGKIDHISTNSLRFDYGFMLTDAIELSKLMMSHPNIITEHCFFIFSSLNLAVYPHGDTGFGCIGLNGDKKSGIDFLDLCKQSNNFKVIINS